MNAFKLLFNSNLIMFVTRSCADAEGLCDVPQNNTKYRGNGRPHAHFLQLKFIAHSTASHKLKLYHRVRCECDIPLPNIAHERLAKGE